MPKEQKCPECEEGAPGWMTTFGDMTTLILTFFVLLISMMVIDPKKYVEVLGVFQKTAGEGYTKPTPEDPIPTEQFFIQIIRASTRRTTVPEGGMNPTVTGETPVVFAHKENYVAKIADTRFFEEFSVMLTKDAKVRLATVAKLAKEGGSNRIRLIGHYSRSESPAKFASQAIKASTEAGKKFDGRGLLRAFEYYDQQKDQAGLIQSNVWINDSEDLAYRRARAVLEYLAQHGVDRQRMTPISGGMISDVRVASASQSQIDMNRGGQAYDVSGVPGESATTDIHAGTAEATQLATPAVQDGMILRQWPHFIFTEGGDDRGRTVEIVMTGEIVGINETFAPPISE